MIGIESGLLLNVYALYLQANPKDADQIFSAIDWRVQQMQQREKCEASEDSKSNEAVSSSVESTSGSGEKRSIEEVYDESSNEPEKKAR